MIMFLVEAAVMYALFGVLTMLGVFAYGIYKGFTCDFEKLKDDPFLQECAAQRGVKFQDVMNTEIGPIEVIACYILKWPVILDIVIGALTNLKKKQGQR